MGLVMLIYDKSGRELRHRILLTFFVVEILTTQGSVARLDLQMVISPQQRKIIKFCGVIGSSEKNDRDMKTRRKVPARLGPIITMPVSISS